MITFKNLLEFVKDQLINNLYNKIFNLQELLFSTEIGYLIKKGKNKVLYD